MFHVSFVHGKEVTMTNTSNSSTERIGLSVHETAVSLGVCEATVANMIRRGKLRATKLGRRTIILLEAVREMLSAGEIQPQAAAVAA